MTKDLTPIIRMIQRSSPVDGWYPVSDLIYDNVIKPCFPQPLWESRQVDGKTLIKLTPEGETLTKYL